MAGPEWFGKMIIVSLRFYAGVNLAKLPSGPILLSASILIVFAVSNYEAWAQSKPDSAPSSAAAEYSRG